MKRNLSVVVPTHNRRDTLLEALRACASQTARDRILEIIVVDNPNAVGYHLKRMSVADVHRPPVAGNFVSKSE